MVIITTGNKSIKGKTGEVLEVIRKEGKDPRVIVAGLNIIKRHTKPSAGNPQGSIVEREASVHISNVALIDANTGKASKVKYQIQDGKKSRVLKSSGAII